MKNKNKLYSIVLASVLMILMLTGIAGAAQYAYITNSGDNTVSVIDTSTNNVTTTVPVGSYPYGVAVNPNGTMVYVANFYDNTVSVIDSSTNTVTSTVSVGSNPMGVAVNPDGTMVYVANKGAGTVSVIDSSTNTVTSTVSVGSNPIGVEVNPDGTMVYVTNYGADTVSVIDSSTNTVTSTVSVGSSPHGVVVNPNGTMVYVANYNAGTVSVIDNSTKTVISTVSVGSSPLGVAVNPDGTMVYVVNKGAGTVSVIDSSTNTVTSTVSVGSNPMGVAVTPDGTMVYIANYGAGTVSVIDSSTNTVTSTVSVGSNPYAYGQFILETADPVLPVANFSSNVSSGYAPLSVQFTDISENAIEWSWDFGDGSNSTEQNPVHTYSAAGNYTVNLTASNEEGTNSTFATITVLEESVLPYSFITAWGSSGSANGSFDGPNGVSVDSSGNVYVADTNNHRIQKFDSSGTFLTAWGSSGSANGSFYYPSGVSVDSSSNVYVADMYNSRIQKFDSSGTFITAWGSPGSANGSFSYLTGVSIDSSGNVYVVDYGNNRIQKFDSSGTFITAWGSSGSANGSFSYPFGVSVDSSGNVYVADDGNNRIQKFDSSGTFLTAWGSSGSANGSFAGPRGVSVDFSGNVYVADTANNRIQKFDSSGTFITAWGSYGSANGSFSYPCGVSVDSSGNVYVADTTNHRIQKFAQSSSVLPVANFSSNVSSGYAPLSVQFTDTSENATEWSWDFGDGSNSTIQSPTHVFYAAGNYTVTLTASNENGTDSIESVINVTAAPVFPVADFSSNVSSGYAPLTVQFNDSSENATGWIWDFGEGNNSTVQNPVHTYSAAGNYTVNLTVSNEDGISSKLANITVLDYSPAYTIEKTVTDVSGNGASANVTKAGDVISYRINVTNAGNIDLTNVSVVDSLINLTVPSESLNSDGILRVGEFWTYTGNYTVTQSDLNSNGGGDGFINNTATVNCTELAEKTDSVAVPIVQNPAYTIEKTVTDVSGNGSSANVTKAGDVIRYSINVTNAGNLDLTNVSVVDSLINLTGPSESLNTDSVLEVGEFWTYTGNYTVTQSDLNSNGGGDGFINNTATVNCTELAEKTDRVSVPIVQNSAYTIEKTVTDVAGNGSSANVTKAGDVISYRINVTNAGNIDLTSVSVVDSLINLTVPSESLNPDGILRVGEFWTYTGNYTVTQSDLNSNGGGDGFINNTATVNCTELTEKTDRVSVPIVQNPAYTIEKTVTDVAGNGSSANVTKAGDVISYRINVTNAGNIDLSNVSVVDSLINLTVPSESLNTDSVLEVGEFWTYTGNYTVSQTDLNSNGGGDGFINNTATVNCTELTVENDSVSVPIVQNPAYTIEKTVTDVSGNGSSANVTKAGDVISYRINVTNAGNVDLTNVSVVDSLINLTVPSESLNTDSVLEVGEFWTYTGNYTVSQTDLNSNGGGDGFINNTATVNCTELTVENDSVSVPIVQNPAYTIEKTVTDVSGNGASANVTKAGDVISYRINVTNAGNLDLTNVSIVDSLINLTVPSGDNSQANILNVGEIWTYTGNYTVSQTDLNSNGGGDGFINNTATVNCTELTEETDRVAVPIVQNPAYTIEKTVTDVAGNGSSANVTKAGDVISYRINVTNAGNIDLTNVSVVDSLINLTVPSESLNSDGILSVGEFWTYTGNYTVTQTDLNSNGGGDGFINNTATVNCTELTEETDRVAVPIVQNSAYTIEKTVTDVSGNGASANVTKAGDVISYRINVTNAGNIDLTNVSVVDSLINLTVPSESLNSDGILSVGEFWTYTGNYTVTQSDLNSNGGGDGFINNTATVNCTELAEKTDSVAVPIVQNPAYTIEKTVTDVAGNGSSANVTKAGDVISYRINVTNAGNLDLTNVSVVDSLINLTVPSGDNSQANILNVGESWTYTGNYTVTQSDLNSNGGGDGFINNTATVNCTELTEETDSISVPIVQNPAYTIEKTVTDVAGNGSSANVTKAGDVISYRINVTNAGNIDLTNVSVVDSLINLTVPSESLNTDSVLEVGEFWTYTGNYTVSQTDLNSNGGGDGFINNTATVNCTELTVENDSVSVPIVQNPAYTIEKTVTDVAGNGSSANVTKAGDVISYRINVTNAGNIDLTNVSVVDSLINLTVPSGDNSQANILNVGESWTYTGNYTVTQSDLNSNGGGDGFINNTATVNCTELTEETDRVAVPIVQNSAYTIEKTVTDVAGNGSSANVTKAGDVISYRINVTNAGNIDLSNVSVVDSLINLTGPSESLNTDSVLEVGEFWTYTGNYTVTQSDLNSNGGGDGFINNTATVNCTELTEETDRVSVPIVQNPAYTIEKTVTDVSGNGSSANVTKAGDVIRYSINVTNAGNIDLTNVSVVDSLINLTGPSGDNSQANILNVGESWTYTGNYTVTQTDLNSNGGGDGFINNTVTVNCTELTVENDSVAVPIVQNPVCSIKKIVVDIAGNGPEGNISSAGDLVQFRVNVTNRGNVDLTNISVSDSLLNLTGPYGDTGSYVNRSLQTLVQSAKTVQYTLGGDGILSVGETWYYLGNYTVTQEDLNNNGGGDGFLNSTVTFESAETEPINETTIQYVDESGNETDNNSSGIYIERNPDYSIYKSVVEVYHGDNGAVDNVGDIVRYSILVTNEGNVELTGVSVVDPMISLVGPVESLNPDGVLGIGENWTYTGNYTVTREDMESNGGGDGDLDNTATVSCNELSNRTSCVEVQLIAPEFSGSGSGHGSGTGSASVISVTEENDELNENTSEENETKIQLEEETEYVEENTGNNAVKPGAADEETTDKNTSKSGVIYWGIGLLVAGLLIVFLYKRRQDEQK